jgi:hypothetical protein
MQIRISISALVVGFLATAIPFTASRAGAEEKGKVIKLKLKDGRARVTARLAEGDPKDRIFKDSFCKVYAVELKAGQVYQIDMAKKNAKDSLDPYLRLETPQGKQLAADDDSGGNLNARIIFRPGKDGTYHIIATGLGKKVSTGEFALTVRQRK